jgi:hypothetical protein
LTALKPLEARGTGAVSLIMRFAARHGWAQGDPVPSLLHDRIHVFVFCLRGEKIRAINLRKALPREARRYANHHD